MTKPNGKSFAILLSLIFIVTACSPQDAGQSTLQIQATDEWEAQAQETLKALTTPATATERVVIPTKTPSPSPTSTFTPTTKPSPTQQAPVLNVVSSP